MAPRDDRKRTICLGTTLVALVTSASLVVGQTPVVAPDNKYSPSEDVQLGRDAARQVEEQLPILRDDGVQSFVDSIGQRLAANIPAEFSHPEFQYTFKVVDVSDINAFALPGGPMYVNRGMIEAAKNEGEVAGVLAHEISHVALRHGTAQASKATKYEIGALAGAVLGAIIGGTAGQIVSQGTQFGLGTAFMRFGRDFERQSDLLGAQTMARTGYDPRDMASMFQTIQGKSGNGGPEWLSSHPNPSNRFQAINQEASTLVVSKPIRNTQAFAQVKSRLQRMPPAPTTEQAAQRQTGRRTSRRGGPVDSPSDIRVGQVERPSTRYQAYEEGNLFRVEVPSNWRELPNNTSVTFAPEGGYGNYQGQSVFTHGVQIGMERTSARNLRAATDDFINALGQNNPQIRRSAGYSNANMSGRRGLAIVLSNVSDVTGEQERITVYTAQLADGSLFYMIGVAPANEFPEYQSVFNQVVRSIELNDAGGNSRY